MKSTKQQLRQRGYPEAGDLHSLSNFGYEELLACLTDPDPVKRSSAAILLQPDVDRAARALLQQLTLEQQLYTRLMICECLQQGTVQTAQQMIPYLGSIGTNQYRQPPHRASLKTSFPLPRDLIARTLGRMTPEVLPKLRAVLSSGSRAEISEGLDAIGYLLAHHPLLASVDLCEQLLAFLKQVGQDDLLLWKGILTLSMVPYQMSLDYLAGVKTANPIHALEAQRSISLITKQLAEK